MQEEFKTTVISFDKNAGKEPTVQVDSKTAQVNVNDPVEENSIKNVLFNVTTKVPHVTTSIQPVEVEIEAETKKPKAKTIEQINPNSKFIPKFYLKEYHRYARILVMWVIIALVATGLSAWGLAAIINDTTISNWVALTLIPGIALAYAFLVVYANNYINYRNEARNVDFSKEKIVTTNVTKLYKRLKTGYINVNWFCGLAYAVGLLGILFTFIIAWAVKGGPAGGQWGNISPEYQQTPLYLILLIAFIATIFIAFFAHIFLLVGNYTRAGKIDSFYSVQIVSDEELEALKKKKNKRNAVIFLVVVAILVLIGILIYKLVKSRKTTNNVTINN